MKQEIRKQKIECRIHKGSNCVLSFAYQIFAPFFRVFNFKLFYFSFLYAFLVLGSFILVFAGFIEQAHASVFTRQSNSLGLVGYWSFEDRKGATATDFSGKGNVITLTNGPSWVSGKVGAGLSFDGSNDYAETTGAATSTNLTSNLSIFAWVKTTTPGTASIATQSNGCGPYGALNGCFGIAIGGSTPNRASAYIAPNWRQGNTSINDGNWHHIGYTFDSSFNLQFYFDGATDSSLIANSAGFPSSSGPFHIGYDSPGYYYNGMLDDVRVYNRVLTAAEVSSLYSQTRMIKLNKPGPLADANLVFYLKMDEASGNAADASGNGLTFTNNSSVVRTTGKIGGAASLSGSNYFSHADSAALSPTTAATWAFWFYKTSAYSGSSNMFTSKWSFNSTNGWGHRTSGTEFEATLENYNYAGITSGLNLTANTWYHAVVVFNGSGVGNSGRLKVYIDGSEKTLTYTGTIPSTISDTTNAFEIGGWSNIGYYFAGKIDEFGFWSRALTASEVTTLYNSGVGLSHPFTTAVAKINNSRNSVASSNLVAWHTFDGSYLTNTTSTDRSSQAKNGTLTNGPVPVMGKIGQALKFDGTNDYVNIATGSGITSDVGVTFSAWVKPSSISTGGSILMNMYGGSKYFGVIINLNGNGSVGLEGGYCGAETASGALENNAWQHVVVAKDPGEIVATTRIYVNGALKSVSAGPYGTCTPTYGGFTSATIGIGWNDFVTYPFAGSLDDVRIYNRALSAAEVLQLYNQGK